MEEKRTYKWELLLWLWLAFFFNQADRQIFNVILPSIKSDLGLTDTQLGLVASIFVLTIGVFIPIAGFAGDLLNRKKIICYSLLFWSLATLLTGTSTTLISLILFRSIAVGGGEAFYAPAANAEISQHHRDTRALALSIHQTSLYAGVILSGWLGGYIAEQYGWQNTFYIFGAAGIVLAGALAWRLRRSVKDTVAENVVNSAFIRNATMALLKNRTALLLISGFACMVFVNVGYLTWTPTFLHEKFGLSLADAGFSSMFYHHVAAFLGVLVGGWLSDKLSLITPKYRFYIQAGGLLIGAPFIFFMGQAGTPVLTYTFLALFGFFRGIYDANIYATLFEVIERKYRSTSAGLASMFAFIAAAFAPYLLGLFKPTLGLSGGLSALSVAYLIGGSCILLAAKLYFQKGILLKTLEV